jgi:hypothetical protein
VRIDINTGKVTDFLKFEIGNLVTITRGHNAGRVGVIQGIERCADCPSFGVIGTLDEAVIAGIRGRSISSRSRTVRTTCSRPGGRTCS